MTSLNIWQVESRALAQGNTASVQALMPMVISANKIMTSAPVTADWDWIRQDVMAVACATFKNSYLECLATAQILDLPVMQRAAAVQHFYTQANALEAREFLDRAHITYVILYPEMQLPFPIEGVPLALVFKNGAMRIYKYVPRKLWG
jgi:hypothetical protein